MRFAACLLVALLHGCATPEPAPELAPLSPEAEELEGAEEPAEVEPEEAATQEVPVAEPPASSEVAEIEPDVSDEPLLDDPEALPLPGPPVEEVVETAAADPPPEVVLASEPPPAPEAAPLMPRLLRLELPMTATLHERGGDGQEVGVEIHDLLLDGARIVALRVAAAVDGDEMQHRLMGARGLWWREGEDGTTQVHLGVRPSDDESRAPEIDVVGLFTGNATESVSGKLEDLVVFDMQTAILKVRDSNNLVHRVLLEPGALALRLSSGLELGDRVAVEGVQTRDEVGKLIVASAFGRAPKLMTLRDERGEILWEELTQSLLSVRELLAAGELSTLDGEMVAIAGIVMDDEAEDVSVLLAVEGSERATSPAQIAPVPDGGWGVLIDGDAVGHLPILSVDRAERE